MLYIFHVDNGTMMTFEMNLALESVNQLKEVIARMCRIPVDKQVLLVSGGECLEPSARVCSYSAGTDTNPIFLFSKNTIESHTPPSPSVDYGSDVDMKDHVESSLNMPDVYKTVVVRSQLAQQFSELAREQTRTCEGLVHDQHLQQQGWAAVVANLEDVTSAFRIRSEMFEQNFLQHLGSRDQYTELMANFKEDLTMLNKIPVLPGLLHADESMMASGEDGSATLTDGLNSKEMSLLQWISAKDNQNSLEQVAEQCARGLEQFDQAVLDSLRKDIEAALMAASKADMKEIKGLEERLCGLEQLMFETKRIVQEQSDLTQAIMQNQARANNLGDDSILPDLCNSHRRQLRIMLKNHDQLRDIRRRCSRAKEELSINLYHRLRWIVYVENNICEVSNKLLIYHENLKRLRRRLDVLQQIHLAPQTYVAAVGEVVRRKTFSKAFLQWARDLSSQLEEIHREETSRRQTFQTQFEGHFLLALFPGLNDFPPSFATEAPPEFDASLPELLPEDVLLLKDQLPELASGLPENYDPPSLVQNFISHCLRLAPVSQSQTEAADSSIGALLQPTSSEAAPTTDLSPQPSLDVPSLPREDRGFESETDTEEFEKVGQSPVDPSAPTSEAPPCLIQTSDKSGSGSGTTTLPSSSIHQEEVGDSSLGPYSSTPLSSPIEFATSDFYIDESLPSSHAGSNDTLSATSVTALSQLRADLLHKDTLIHLLQENLGGVRGEEERIRGFLHSLAHVALVETRELRCQLSVLRDFVNSPDQNAVEAVKILRKELTERLVQQQRLDEEQVTRYEQMLQEKGHSLALAREDVARAEAKEVLLKAELQAQHAQALETLGARLRAEADAELQQKLAEAQAEAQVRLEQAQQAAEDERVVAVKEVSDRLLREHRLEIEGLRSRFRMVHASQMERSPSDTSLEKIERGDLMEVASHEAALNRLRQELAAEQTAAVAESAARERRRLEVELDRERTRLVMQESAKQVAFNEALRRVAADKDRQMESLREETEQLRTTVERLSQAQTAAEREIGEQRDTIRRLQHQRSGSRNRRHVTAASSSVHDSAMSTSVAVLTEGLPSRDTINTSPETSRRRLQEESFRERLSRSTHTLIQQGTVSIATCNVGDTVLVLWDDERRNFTILQNSTTWYFLHSDSIEGLGLPPVPHNGAPRKTYCIGQVAKKEYCFARKAENRFGVPKDTKFYRVMVNSMPNATQSQQAGVSGRSGSSGGASMSSSQQLSRSDLEPRTMACGPGNSSTL